MAYKSIFKRSKRRRTRRSRMNKTIVTYPTTAGAQKLRRIFVDATGSKIITA